MADLISLNEKKIRKRLEQYSEGTYKMIIWAVSRLRIIS
jgi:hypothetical protein